MKTLRQQAAEIIRHIYDDSQIPQWALDDVAYSGGATANDKIELVHASECMSTRKNPSHPLSRKWDTSGEVVAIYPSDANITQLKRKLKACGVPHGHDVVFA